ncbi:unnamed protein product, partial [marine sediment metagenome]
MVTTLHFIPGVPSISIVSFPNGLHYSKSLFNESLIYEVRSDLVFYAGPNLITVDKGKLRSSSFGPGAEQKTFLIIEDIGALNIMM